MAFSNPTSLLQPIFSHRQLELIGQIVNTKISEIIASGGLVCSHCSSSSQVPWLPADSKVAVPTMPLQAFDKQLKKIERQLSDQATKLQQFIEHSSDIGADIIIQSFNQ
jgi:hypothetical protein